MAGEWQRTHLGDLIEFTRDGEWGSDQSGPDRQEMLVVRGTDFARLRLGALTEMPRRYIDRTAAERKQLCAGDVLIETAGGTKDQSTGRTAFVKQSHIDRAGLPITCASFARFLRFDRDKVEPGFIYWWLQSLHASGEMETHQVQHTGVARFQFTKFVEHTEVPLPPLPEQRAIAHILGTLDDKIELNRRTNETLEAIARVIFKSWFVNFDPVRAKAEGRDPGLPKPLADLFPDSFEDSELGEIPKGWRIATIRELTSNIQYGLTQSASAEKVGPHFLRITDIQGGTADWSTVPFCKVTLEEHERYRLKSGDVLVARTGASTGENTYLSVVPDAVFASYLVRFQFTDPAIARMVGAYMRTQAYFDYIAGCIGGSAQPNASARVLAGAELVVPMPELACLFADFVAPLDKRIAANTGHSRTLAALRDTLLPKLISGELRIPNVERIISEVHP